MKNEFCQLTDEASNLLKLAIGELSLSARAYDKIRKVARTIADKADAFRLPPSPGKRKNIHLSALCASVVRSNCR